MKRINLLQIYLLSMLLAACAGAASGGDGSAELNVQETEGKRVFEQYCKSCHATQGDTVVVGPSLAGIGQVASQRVESLTAEEYLLQSIEKPSAYLGQGFDDIMPISLGQELSGDQKEAIIAYLLTLR